MSPYVKRLVRETGKKEEEVEQLWTEAKKVTEETFGKPEEEFGEREFEYSREVVYRSIGIDETWNISEFIKSDLSAKEFIEAAVQTSGDFSTPEGGTVNKKKKDDDDEEEEESTRVYKQDGSGPHGQGKGPGKGKADGSGLKKESTEDEAIFSGLVPIEETTEEE